MKKNICILLMLLFLSGTGCSGPYTIEDNGATIELSEHTPFTVILEADSNSANVWELASQPAFIELAQPVSKVRKGNKTEYIFTFKAIGDGEENLQIDYTDGKGVRQSFNATIIVGTMGLIEAK